MDCRVVAWHSSELVFSVISKYTRNCVTYRDGRITFDGSGPRSPLWLAYEDLKRLYYWSIRLGFKGWAKSVCSVRFSAHGEREGWFIAIPQPIRLKFRRRYSPPPASGVFARIWRRLSTYTGGVWPGVLMRRDRRRDGYCVRSPPLQCRWQYKYRGSRRSCSWRGPLYIGVFLYRAASIARWRTTS